MGFELPNPNTHPNVAKEQHLVPRTYMRMWSYNNGDLIWVVDKTRLKDGINSKNVDNINYVVGFHDIKAGDVYVPDEALDDIYGFMKGYQIEIDGIAYSTLREFDNHFYDFDKWVITIQDGSTATKKIKNEIKRVICQSRYTFIETEWCRQFESNWSIFIKNIEAKLRCNVLAKPYHISEDERITLLEHILIFDFRNIKGNAWINEIINDIFPNELAKTEIPKEDRVHQFNKTIGDEVKYEVRIRAFYEYLKNRDGKIRLMLEKYSRNLGIKFCLAPENNTFITCETPSMMIRRFDGLLEHIFMATPTLLITTFKTDNTGVFIKEYLKAKDIKRYNKYIAQNADVIITNREGLNFKELLR